MASEHLPEELIEEILIRLPAKSIARLKSVCKSFYTLMTNKRFITEHFSYSTAKNQPNLLVFHAHNNFSSTLVFDNNLSQPPIHLMPPSPYPDHLLDEIIAYGPCNGIVCLQVSRVHNLDRLMLWNPATRDVKALPMPHHMNILPGECFVEVHGFGVDPMTSEYKVVNLIAGVKSGTDEGMQPTAQVYSLSTNSWNIIDVTISAYDIIDSPFTSYLNGVYHWLIKPEDDESILCFNMSNNAFWKMNLPPVSQGDANEMLVDSNFAIIEDFVAYMKEYKVSSLLGTRVEIWVMSEYSVEESWTKKFNIILHFEERKFWGFWKKDEALITKDYNLPLISYNFNTQQSTEVVPINIGVVLHAFRYVESIVPLSIEEED